MSKLHEPEPGLPTVSTGLVVPVRSRFSASPGKVVGALPLTEKAAVLDGLTVNVSFCVLPLRTAPPGAVTTPAAVAAAPAASVAAGPTSTLIVTVLDDV